MKLNGKDLNSKKSINSSLRLGVDGFFIENNSPLLRK